jgi:hypothetical protein
MIVLNEQARARKNSALAAMRGAHPNVVIKTNIRRTAQIANTDPLSAGRNGFQNLKKEEKKYRAAPSGLLKLAAARLKKRTEV